MEIPELSMDNMDIPQVVGLEIEVGIDDVQEDKEGGSSNPLQVPLPPTGVNVDIGGQPETRCPDPSSSSATDPIFQMNIAIPIPMELLQSQQGLLRRNCNNCSDSAYDSINSSSNDFDVSECPWSSRCQTKNDEKPSSIHPPDPLMMNLRVDVPHEAAFQLVADLLLENTDHGRQMIDTTESNSASEERAAVLRQILNDHRIRLPGFFKNQDLPLIPNPQPEVVPIFREASGSVELIDLTEENVENAHDDSYVKIIELIDVTDCNDANPSNPNNNPIASVAAAQAVKHGASSTSSLSVPWADILETDLGDAGFDEQLEQELLSILVPNAKKEPVMEMGYRSVDENEDVDAGGIAEPNEADIDLSGDNDLERLGIGLLEEVETEQIDVQHEIGSPMPIVRIIPIEKWSSPRSNDFGFQSVIIPIHGLDLPQNTNDEAEVEIREPEGRVKGDSNLMENDIVTAENFETDRSIDDVFGSGSDILENVDQLQTRIVEAILDKGKEDGGKDSGAQVYENNVNIVTSTSHEELSTRHLLIKESNTCITANLKSTIGLPEDNGKEKSASKIIKRGRGRSRNTGNRLQPRSTSRPSEDAVTTIRRSKRPRRNEENRRSSRLRRNEENRRSSRPRRNEENRRSSRLASLQQKTSLRRPYIQVTLSSDSDSDTEMISVNNMPVSPIIALPLISPCKLTPTTSKNHYTGDNAIKKINLNPIVVMTKLPVSGKKISYREKDEERRLKPRTERKNPDPNSC